jgi:hypothetical protein
VVNCYADAKRPAPGPDAPDAPDAHGPDATDLKPPGGEFDRSRPNKIGPVDPPSDAF